MDFAVSFPFQAKADLVVLSTIIATGVQTTKALTTDYTIAGATDSLGFYSSGGTVTFLVAPANTVRITIYRDPARTQGLDLVENDSLPAESLEAQLDYVTMLLQRVSDLIGRSLRQPDGDSTSIGTLPSSVDRASKFMAFDASGDPISAAGTSANLTPVSAFIDTLLDDATAAIARATLGAVGLTGDEVIAGAKTFSSAIPSPTLTTPTLTSPTVSTGPLTMTSGKIAFPATQVPSAGANDLDDYEEGSWTPSVGGTATYITQVGLYVKIGRMVTATCQLTINNIGSGSTTVISGLPFTSVTQAAFSFTGAPLFSSLSQTVSYLVAVVDSNVSNIKLFSILVEGASVAQNAVIGNSTSIQATVTYLAAN